MNLTFFKAVAYCGAVDAERQSKIDEALAAIEKQFGGKRVGEGMSLRRGVATYKNGRLYATLAFGRGRFDDWCIYVIGNAGFPKAPTDEWYFSQIKKWAVEKSPQEIYDDFVKIYDLTTGEVRGEVLELIDKISFNYRHQFTARVIFTILYMGMIAEENKAGKILGKRIKRLGMHELLIDWVSSATAAHFSRGKDVRLLVMECHSRGF